MNTLTETLFTVLEAVGTVAFAVSGATVALQRRLDVFGVMLLGLTTALGGGCIRDLLLGRTPPVMFSQPLYAIVAIATSLIVFLLAWYWRIGFLAIWSSSTVSITSLMPWVLVYLPSSAYGQAWPPAMAKMPSCACSWGCSPEWAAASCGI